MIVALCKVNKDHFESNIIMHRLILILYIEIQDNIHGINIFYENRIYFWRLVSLGPHTIVISYNPEPTIPEASYGQSHNSYDLTMTIFQMKNDSEEPYCRFSKDSPLELYLKQKTGIAKVEYTVSEVSTTTILLLWIFCFSWCNSWWK